MKFIFNALLPVISIGLMQVAITDHPTSYAAPPKKYTVEFNTKNIVRDGQVLMRRLPDGPPGTIAIDGDKVIFGLEYYSGEDAKARFEKETSLARELARQAVLLTAREQFGYRTRDVLLGEALPENPDEALGRIGSLFAWNEREIDKKPHILIGAILTQQTAADAKADIAPVSINRYDDLLAGDQTRVLEMTSTGMANATIELYPTAFTGLNLPQRPLKKSDSIALPDELLNSQAEMNFLVQYERIRQLHQFIETHGPNWEANKQLSLAYAHLGMLTEYFWSEHSSVYYARALLYAIRNVNTTALKPDQIAFARKVLGRTEAQDQDPEPLENLAYIWAVIGRHDLALQTLQEYDDAVSAKKIVPAKTISPSLYYARTIAYGDLESLANPSVKTQKNLGPLFHYRLLEYSGNADQMIELHNIAMSANPNCLRLHDSLEFGKTVGILRYGAGLLSSHTPAVLSEFLPTLNSLPADARKLIDDYKKQPNELNARIQLMRQLKTFSKDNYAAGELSPAVLASMLLNRSFITADTQTVMADKYLGWHTDRYVKMYRPLVVDHPFAALIELRQPDLAVAREGLEKIYAASFNVPAPSFRHLRIRGEVSEYSIYRLNKPISYGFRGSRLDQTYHGILTSKLTLREGYSSWVDSTHLIAVSPNAELPVYYQIKDELKDDTDWAALENKYSKSVIILPALAERYSKAEQQDDQIRVLEKLTTLSQSESHFSDLATVYWNKEEPEKWTKVAQEMLQLPRKGLKTSNWETRLAYYHMNKGEKKEALEHAEHAALSYSGTSLECLAVVQSHFEQYDDAEATFAKATERYPVYAKVWYRWAHAHGRDDLKAPEQKTYEYYDSLGAPVPSSSLIEIFDFYVMNKQPQKALEVFRAIESYSDIGPEYLLLAVVVTDEQGETRDRDAILSYLCELNGNKEFSNNLELINTYAADLKKFISSKDKSLLDLSNLDRMLKKAEAGDNAQQLIALISGYFLATRGYEQQGMKAIKFAAYMGDLPSTWNVMARQVLRRQGEKIGPANKGLDDQ